MRVAAAIASETATHSCATPGCRRSRRQPLRLDPTRIDVFQRRGCDGELRDGAEVLLCLGPPNGRGDIAQLDLRDQSPTDDAGGAEFLWWQRHRQIRVDRAFHP